MSQTGSAGRRRGRRAGYAVAVIVNLVLLVIVNVAPGWQSWDFVTPQAADVVGFVNASLAVSAVANVVYLVVDGLRVKALGELLIGIVSLAASVMVLRVFPFDFSGYAFPWALLVRLVLWLGVLGSAVSIIVNLVRLLTTPRNAERPA